MLPVTPSFVKKDPEGKITLLDHFEDPYFSAAFGEPSAEQLADEYVAAIAADLGMQTGLSDKFAAPVDGDPTGGGPGLHRQKVKEVDGSVVVSYAQSYCGLPIWRAGIAVHLATEPLRVTSASSTVHSDVTLANDPDEVASEYAQKLTKETLEGLIGTAPGKGISKINGMKLLVYRYDPDERLNPGLAQPPGNGASFEPPPPMPTLPAVPHGIEAGKHYVVAEVLFDLALKEWEGLHWRALIEPMSGAVLYVRALTAFVTGSVFRMDPISLSGNGALIPSAAEASLNSWRTSVALADLATATPQGLSGSNVNIAEVESPTEAGPTTTGPAFTYGAKSTQFAAVNAYYHVNWFFNLIRGMGFNLSTYFDGTSFPVSVDHWSLGAAVNAHCPGNSHGDGIGHFCFGAAQAGQTVGIADDPRVVIHEFGHGLLWDHVGSPNFGFAHSAGDGLAAILMDPDSHAPDRFLTFPWPQSGSGPLDRRHDRSVTGGWGWFGTQYDRQYRGEQVLSTTLFRVYRSAGGDSPHAADRAWASRYVSYLIIKAIGTLTTTTNDPEVFVTALMNADRTTTTFEGHPGGALHKVIRWAFEKQGLFQPNARPGTTTPVTRAGDPPEVDVYIDDGRHGEYDYLYGFWESKDMWARRAADGGTTHQEPVVGKTNYMYVRVSNRGSMPATDVSVKAYHCTPGSGLSWPDHWRAMDTPVRSAPGSVPPGGSVVVGPFAWKPEAVGHECLLAIASTGKDLANDSTVMSSIAHSRFVPFDNNIGQRNIAPVRALDWKRLLVLLRKMPFHVVNPWMRPVKVELVPVLPKSMKDAKQWVLFDNPGGNKFTLAPFETKKIGFSVVSTPQIPTRVPWKKKLPIVMKPGIFEPEGMFADVAPDSLDALDSLDEMLSKGRPVHLRIVTLIDGQNMGGMTYVLQTGKELVGKSPFGVSDDMESEDATSAGESVIDRIRELARSDEGVKSARVTKVTLEVELDE